MRDTPGSAHRPPHRIGNPPEESPRRGRRARHRRRWLAARHPVLVGSVVLFVVAAGTAIGIITAPAPQQDTEGANLAGPLPGNSATSPAPARQPTRLSPSPSAKPHSSASRTRPARPRTTTQAPGRWPNGKNTGVPAGVKLHSCPRTISRAGTYDACRFDGGVTVKASNVRITRSLIKGQVDAGSGGSADQHGLVISDSTIDCGCLADETHTPAAIGESNYTLLRVNLFNSGHGAAVKSNVTIQDSYIHGLGADTQAHKDGIYSGDGSNVVIRNNTIECNAEGCTSAIGLLSDFGPISNYTIDGNLLNTSGSYCFYGSGGPQKNYTTNHITFTNNHFGRAYGPKCGRYGPVTYFDARAPGMVWSGNVWEDSGAPVKAAY